MCAKEDWDNIDVVLSVGTRYQAPASWGQHDGKKLIRIDIDANQSVQIANTRRAYYLYGREVTEDAGRARPSS